ncbi:MAG: VWA domain-containing protein [Phycisphaerales bacterium]|nr:MAG: VWA domain-containing protein [Phycisphaerales bacterium]
MSWLTPWLGGVAAMVAVPSLVILYFLKLRRRDQEVSSTLLWRKSIQDLQANAPFQKLRRNILLLLQLLVMGGVLLALAQPMLEGEGAASSRHIILIDRSASMRTVDAGEGRDPVARFEAAKARALEIVDGLRDGGAFGGFGGRLLAQRSPDEAMVIAFDTTAEVRAAFTGDKAALRRAIEAIEPTDAPGSLEEAMRLALAHAPTRTYFDERSGEIFDTGLAGGEPATVHLISDGGLADAQRALPRQGDEIVFHRIGQPETWNVGITGIRAERDFETPTRARIFVGLQSTATEAKTVDVELLIDGVRTGVRSVTIPGASEATTGTGGARRTGLAGERDVGPIVRTRRTPATTAVVFNLDREQAGLVAARVDAGDPFATDDRAWVALPPARQLSAAVVTRGNFFLAAAMEGLPLRRLDRFTPEAFEEELASGRAASYDVIVLDGWLPAPEIEAFPPGRYLIFDAVPAGAAGLVDRGEGPATVVLDWSRDHPLLRELTLEPLVIAESRRVALPENSAAQVLAETDVGPAILDLTVGGVRSVVVPFDVARTNWPFDVSFVVFLASAAEFLGGGAPASGAGEDVLRPGRVLTDRLPAGARDVELRLPGGDRARLTPGPDGRIAFGPVRTAGVYQAFWDGPSAPTDGRSGGRHTRVYVANLADPIESDIGAADVVELATEQVRAAEGGLASSTRRLWPWLVLAAIALLTLEWYVYNRKVQL